MKDIGLTEEEKDYLEWLIDKNLGVFDCESFDFWENVADETHHVNVSMKLREKLNLYDDPHKRNDS